MLLEFLSMGQSIEQKRLREGLNDLLLDLLAHQSLPALPEQGIEITINPVQYSGHTTSQRAVIGLRQETLEEHLGRTLAGSKDFAVLLADSAQKEAAERVRLIAASILAAYHTGTPHDLAQIRAHCSNDIPLARRVLSILQQAGILGRTHSGRRLYPLAPHGQMILEQSRIYALVPSKPEIDKTSNVTDAPKYDPALTEGLGI